MIALQEEMDWLVYRAYGLLNKQLSASAFNWSNPKELSSLKRIQEIAASIPALGRHQW